MLVSYQVTKKKRKVIVCKTLLREKEQEIEARDQSRIALAKSIKSMVTKFPHKAGQEDEDSVSRVSCLSKIMVELKKQVEELREKKVPITPPVVLEEHIKAMAEAMERITQGETIYTVEVEVISSIWEAILEDETV